MNVPIEECEEIIGHRQYWLLHDVEHRELFQFLWNDCDTLLEFKDILYSDPNLCNTKAAAWFLHHDSDSLQGYLSRWFNRQQMRFCVDRQQKFITLESGGSKTMIPMAMLLRTAIFKYDEQDFCIAVVEEDDFNPLLFSFHSLICGDDIVIEGHHLQGNFALYYGEGYMVLRRLSPASLDELLESGVYDDVHEIGGDPLEKVAWS